MSNSVTLHCGKKLLSAGGCQFGPNGFRFVDPLASNILSGLLLSTGWRVFPRTRHWHFGAKPAGTDSFNPASSNAEAAWHHG